MIESRSALNARQQLHRGLPRTAGRAIRLPQLEQAGKLTDITSVLRTQHQRGRVLTDRVLAATTAAAAFDHGLGTLAQDMAASECLSRMGARGHDGFFPALRDVMSAVEFRDIARNL